MSRRLCLSLTNWVQDRQRHEHIQRTLGMPVTSDLPRPCKVEIRDFHSGDCWSDKVASAAGLPGWHGYGLLLGDRAVWLGPTQDAALGELRRLAGVSRSKAARRW